MILNVAFQESGLEQVEILPFLSETLYIEKTMEKLRKRNMPVYVILSNLTEEGRKTIKTRPERIKEVNREIESMGAKIINQYALLGHYDFVTVLEAPDNETVTKISLEMSSRGTINTITLAAIPVDDLIKGLQE